MKTKKILSIVLCAAMVMGVTACNEESSKNPSSSTTTTTIDDDIRNPVNVDDFVKKEEEKKLDNPNLTYFSHYDMRVAGDIKPGVKLFEETYGGKIEYEQVGWGERIEKLQVLITTGDAPDLVDVETLTFPYFMSMNMYTDLTEYIDLSEPQWVDYKNLVESYSWNGKHYYYPFRGNAIPNCLIYDAERFRSLNLDNPKELYEKDQWNWNTFKQVMVDFVTKNPDALGGLQGLISDDIFITTGVPLISIENGKAVNNINTPVIDRAAGFLMELRKEGLTVRGDGMWSNETDPIKNGKVAFLGVGQWLICGFTEEGMDYEFVPYPRDPQADKYYYQASTFGYMVPSGSKNPEGAAAFIDIMRQCYTNPEFRAVIDQSTITDKGYSQEQYDFLTSFDDMSKFDVVVENYTGFSAELTQIIDDMCINVAFEEGQGDQKGNSWTWLRATNEGSINGYLSEYLG